MSYDWTLIGQGRECLVRGQKEDETTGRPNLTWHHAFRNRSRKGLALNGEEQKQLFKMVVIIIYLEMSIYY
jgi:hypothetical protein